MILLPHTGPGEGPALGERIRAAVAERPFVANESHPAVSITVSVGVVGTAAWPVDPDALLARADAACYRAKEGGRNRVEGERPRVGRTDEGRARGEVRESRVLREGPCVAPPSPLP